MLALQGSPDYKRSLQPSGYETLYMVADLHAITTPYDRTKLRAQVREVVLDYLAAGLDPEKSAIFIQSDLADLHAQLAYYLSTVVTIARMQHLPTYKEKVKEFPKANTMALLNYPVLMAADILVYQAGLVPVGIDQEPHLEIAREIARKMNSEYGTHFPEPQRFATKGEYVPSLTGEGKMSKSVEGSFINLTDDLKTIKTKLAKVPTDSGHGYIKHGIYLSSTSLHGDGKVKNVAPSGGVKTLMILVELFQGNERRKECDKQYISVGVKYSELKEELANAIYEELKPIQEKRRQLQKDKKYIDKVLAGGAKKARKIAQETIAEVKAKMGLS